MAEVFSNSVPFINDRLEFWLRDRFGYRFTKGRPNDYRFRVLHRSGRSYRSQIITYPNELVLQLFVFLTDDQYPAAKEGFVRDLCQHLTAHLAFGAFLFADDGGGAAIYRDSEHYVEPSGIPRLLHRSSFAISLFQAGFSGINLPKATGKSAAKMATLLMDTDEGQGIASNLMEQLLMVSDGQTVETQRSTAQLRLVADDDASGRQSLFDL